MKRLFFLMIMLGAVNLFAQNNFMPNTFRLSVQSGRVFPTNTFLKGQNAQHESIRQFETLSFSLGRQTKGKQYWQQTYNYPYLGAGLYVASFKENSPELGRPIALYGFFSAPFARWKRLSFNYELQLGFAFNWKPFNPLYNPNNISIGAKQSVYIDVGLHLDYNLSKNLSIEAGGSFSHFSNGALKKPNYGINTFAPRLSLTYRPENNLEDLAVSQISPKLAHSFEWNLSLFAGITNVIFDSLKIDVIEKYEGISYATYGLTSSVNWTAGRKSKLGLGLTVGYHTFYDAVVAVIDNEIEKIDAPISNKLALSIFPSYELVIDRLSILIQPAYYIYRSKLNDNNPRFYQRLGIRYRVSDKIFVGANLRAFDFHVSDFIEWNIGYTLTRRNE